MSLPRSRWDSATERLALLARTMIGMMGLDRLISQRISKMRSQRFQRHSQWECRILVRGLKLVMEEAEREIALINL